MKQIESIIIFEEITTCLTNEPILINFVPYLKGNREQTRLMYINDRLNEVEN